MKTTKTEVKKKASKKDEKKELQKNLSNKFFEAVKSLGHDAETIAEDLVLVSKFLAKKIGKKVSGTKKAAGKKTAAVSPETAEVAKTAKVKATGKNGKKAIKAPEVLNNTQVTDIASKEKLAQVMPKPTASTKSPAKKTAKPAVKASTTKTSSRKTNTDAE